MVTLTEAEAGVEIRAKVKLGHVNSLGCPQAASEPIVPFSIHLVRISQINSQPLLMAAKEINPKKSAGMVTIVNFSSLVIVNFFIWLRMVLQPLF